jgi:HSP20 family protein
MGCATPVSGLAAEVSEPPRSQHHELWGLYPGNRSIPPRPSATIELVAFARWDPLRDLLAIQHRLERIASSGPQGWAPAVDLCETSDAFIVTAELPGLGREQINIQVNDGRLSLQGRRDARVPCEQYHQVERGHGEFARTFALPPSVDVERIAADLRDGVLTITIPKSPDKATRRVDVS